MLLVYCWKRDRIYVGISVPNGLICLIYMYVNFHQGKCMYFHLTEYVPYCMMVLA